MVQEVNSDLQIRTPRLNVDVDRDKAAALGLDFQQIEGALYYAYGPNWASTIYAPQNQYRVMLEVEDRVSGSTATCCTPVLLKLRLSER